VYAGADPRYEVLWTTPKAAAHLAHSLFDDALHGSAPARMKNADRAILGVCHDYGQTISGLDRHQNSGGRRDQTVANEWMSGEGFDWMNEVRMDLTQRDQGPRMFAARSKFLKKCRAVAFNRRPGILLRKPQIQRVAAIPARRAAATRRKAVNEPGHAPKVVRLKNRNFGFCGDPGWHLFILPKPEHSDGLRRMPHSGSNPPRRPQKKSGIPRLVAGTPRFSSRKD
jgi:hypothetical protein